MLAKMLAMLERLVSLFVLKSGFEAGLVIFALGLGGAMRGHHYLEIYPGTFGWLLYGACLLTALIAGAAVVDGVKAWRVRRPETLRRVRVVARAHAA